ncbi:CPA2 family monovalent cation:H+ antiporter-2 [Parabacteroides sp. PFB2-12]|uniref:cation:proton antiporter n=1 Tax=unclassified Parabacteroides TaxID=2649774 RepID=UPI0024770201|nr:MULTISPECIES: cation:proton antiporter [unclassified Parabacteroides]MDH6343727.1 CPA2 family monovalent cation:H+ antiporter-2 [Parabacteroides sp. PM6-13]MDH6391363.1 CPA2 family monovalent cation:H+ antiporter-2 [Parabacteroides sp. PFB2-12]
MTHLHDFIGDLALILITAGIATILFKWLKQPVVLGYIVAGFIAGPYITWLPTVTDMGNVEIWSEIGVIFLLFALGLDFSFKKLMDVGGTASIATLINMGSMILIGYIVGQLLDWSQMDSIFLGGMLSMSSTTIIIKAFNDMGLQKQKFAGIVFGMLIVEDLAAILMMVLLSTVAVSHTIEGVELLNSLLRLMFFVLVWFIVGIYLIPTMLKKLGRYLNDETLLIVSIGLCLGMVLFASKVGFSAALGAFIMGSILAETVKAKAIEHLVEPIKTFFGAIFFVSVGMMLDPNIIVEYATLIVVLTLVVLVGRIIFATLGVLASGEGLKVAIQAGFSLAQIGEFSFIIATLGNSLGVISNTLYPIIVAVSIITTFTTPYCIRLSTPFYNWIEKHTPANLTRLLEGYASSNLKTVNKRTHWNRLLRSILQFTAVYATVSLAVVYLSEYFITPFILENVPAIWGRLLAATITLILMAPFLRAIMMKKNRSEEFKSLWEDNHFNRGALISLIVLRVVICIGLTMMVLTPLFPNATVWLWVISGGVVTCIIFFQGFKTQSRRMEARFLENLNQKQLFEEKRAPIHPKIANALLSKDIHLEEIDVSPSSPKIGKTLRDLDLRSRYGVNVVSIIRGSQKINIPDANERIYPYDKMIVAGSDEDIQNMTKVIADRAQVEIPEETPTYQISLSQYVVEPGSPLIGETIQSMNIQNQTECMIINIERDDVSIIHIYPDFMFEEGDTLLLAGEKEKLNAFEENLGLIPPFIGILHTDAH